MNQILMSVDMDEWYQCRWATGSEFALWPDTGSFFQEYYHTQKPIGEIIPLTEKILLIFDEHDITATFFFTGEIANYYPDLVKEVVSAGHEIGCHNYVHKDYNEVNRLEFSENLKKSRRLLQKISGQGIIGYRAPNSTLSNYMIKDLIDMGFLYDSSVTPTHSFQGKFGNFRYAPLNPYQLSKDDFSRVGDSGLWEFPLPVFPLFHLPSGSGIMTRIAGYRYTIIALENALKSGDSVYYFHPYEIGPKPRLGRKNIKIDIFLKNIGESYLRVLDKIIRRYKGRFTNGKSFIEQEAQR